MDSHDDSDSALSTGIHKILARIRSLKNFVQLEDVYNELLLFLNSQDSKIREVEAGLDISPVLSSQLSVLDRVNLCSLLTAAFSRRARVLMQNKGTMLSADAVGLVSPTGGDASQQANTSQVLAWVRELADVLKGIGRSPAVIQALRIELSHNDYFSHDDGTFWALEASLSYGHGELHDIKAEQYAKNVEKLNTLLLKSHPDIDMIVEAIKDLSELRYDETEYIFELVQGSESDGKIDADIALRTTRVVTPLRDLISRDSIQVPARGIKCAHFEVFDVGSFIRMTMQRKTTRSINNHHTNEWGAPCPLCCRFIALVDLRVDRTVLQAIQDYTGYDEGKLVSLTANHALEWDLEKRTCRVIEGCNKDHVRARADSSEMGVLLEDFTQDDPSDGIHKKRRVEIDGHVLYVDE